MSSGNPVQETENKLMTKYCALISDNSFWKDSLDTLFQATREEMIYDNLVIYQKEPDSKNSEALYAKSTGRGKSAEADASWGETTANHVIEDNKVIIEKPQNENGKNRITSAYLLGIPIHPVSQLPGALIFIRFGGPDFSQKDRDIAQWTANVATSILRRKMLEEFMVKIEEVQAISKLQSEFISTISHELRSPLGFIKGYTTTLLRTDTNWDRETQKDFLEIIERETNNLTELIEDLLDSSRLQSGQMKFDFFPVRLDSLIRDEVNRIHLTNPQLRIEMDFDIDIPAIEGDPRKLAQVFDNLLSNEIKYAPEALVLIQLRKHDTFIEINFIDNGPGIPEVYLPRIFTRFFRVPESSMKAHGSGLGLFICKQIIDSHRGTISATSSTSGTNFKITLPLAVSSTEGLK